MGGTITSPLSQETRDLFKENQKFFEALGPALQDLKVKMGDPETVTETTVLSNGDVEVTFVYPLDDNNEVADGRLYLRDRFVYDSKESQVKDFTRHFSYNGEGDREHWKPLLSKMEATLKTRKVLDKSSGKPQMKEEPAVGLPSKESAVQFAMTAGRSYSRPFTKPVKDILRTKEKYFQAIAPILAEEGGLQIKIADKDTHYTIIRHPGKNGLSDNTTLIFSYAIPSNDEKTTGKIYLRDTFIVNANGEVLGYDRNWDIDVNAKPADRKKWKAIAERLREKAKPSTEEAKAFLTGFVPTIYDVHPTPSTEKAEYVPPTPPEGGYYPMTEGNFSRIMDEMAKRKKTITGEKIESDLLQTLPLLDMLLSTKGVPPYFGALQEAVQPEIQLNLADPRIKFSTHTQGERTVLNMEMTLSEGAWAEKSDGVIRYKERFVFEKGKLADVDRSWKIDGADPKGRLAAVSARLQQFHAEGRLPSHQQVETQLFSQAILPYVAPDLLYVGMPKAIEAEGLDFDRKMVLSTLGEIHENLKSPLSFPGVDAKLAGRLRRALTAVEHGDVDTFQRTMQEIERDAGEAMKSAEGDAKKALQDVRNMGMIISMTVGAQFDEARIFIDHLNSPILKNAFFKPIDKIWRRKHTLETVSILSQVALDELSLRAQESTKWTHRGPRVNAEAETKVLMGLFQKALAFATQSNDTDTQMALHHLQEIKKFEDRSKDGKFLFLSENEKKTFEELDAKKKESLNEEEKKTLEKLRAKENALVLTEEEKQALNRVLAIPVTEKLVMIERERSKEMQAKQYFELARGELFEKGYVGSAHFLAQKVAIEKLPKSRALEGIALFGEAASEILQMRMGMDIQEKGMKALKEANELSESDDKEKFNELYKGTLDEINNVEEIKSLRESGEAISDLLKKLITQAGAKPDQPVFVLLTELTGLSDRETNLRKLILTDPAFQNISAAGKIKNREERLGAYKKILEELAAKDPSRAEGAQKMILQLANPEFPPVAAVEGTFIILSLAIVPIERETIEISSQLFSEKIFEKATKEVRKQAEAPQQALGDLVAKAKLEAANRPEASLLEILKGLKDDQLTPEEKKLRDSFLTEPVVVTLSSLASESKPEERKNKYKAFTKGIGTKTAFLTAAGEIAKEPKAKKREAMLKKLTPAKDAPQVEGAPVEKNPQFDEGQIKKLEELAKETSNSKRQETLMAFTKDPAFKEAGMQQLAIWLNQSVEMGKIPEAIYHPEDPKRIEDERFAKEVKDFIDNCEGKGNFGAKVGYGMPHFVQQVASPTMLAAMFGAGLAGPYMEMRSLAYMRNLGFVRNLAPASRLAKVAQVGTGLTASGVGIGVESLAFNTIHKTGDMIFDHSATWDPNAKKMVSIWENFGGDVGSTALLFAGMRVGHFASSTFAERVLASGKPGFKWAGGRVAGQPGSAIWTTPAGRVYLPQTLARPGVPQLTAAGKTVKGILDHTSGVGMMFASGYASRAIGWQKKNNQDWQGNLVDAIIGYTHATIGFSLANRLTGGAFQKGVAEVKLRTQQISADPIGSVNKAKAAGMVSILNGERKDVQLSDMAEGKAHVEIRLGDGEEFFLDQALLGQDGKSIVVKKKSDGTMMLVDTRTLPPEGTPPPAEAKEGEFPPVPAKNEPIHIDGEQVPPNVEVPLFESQVIRAGERQLGVSLPARSPLVAAFAELTPDYQMRLAQKLQGAKDLTSLMKDLQTDWRDGGPLTRDVLKALIKGELLLHQLPLELAIQNRLRELMKAEVEKLSKEFSLKDYKLSEDWTNPKWSQLEAEFQLAQKVRAFKEGVSMSQEIGHLLYFLKESHLQTIEGFPAETVRKWLEVQSLKSRKKDVERELAETKKELEELVPKKDGEEGKAEGEEVPALDRRAQKRKAELEIRIQQLEKTLQVVEQWFNDPELQSAMNSDIPNVQGARQKALDVLGQQLKPLAETLSKAEANTLLKLVQEYLEFNVPNDLGIAQTLLRVHFDAATPRARKLLIKAMPGEKALIFKVYLGEPPLRSMSESAASEIVSWLAQGGMDGVAKVTYLPEGGRYVPHLSVAESGYEGAKDGFNVIHARSRKAEGHEALFSVEEFQEIVKEAKDYVAQGHAEKNGASALFDPQARTYNNWLVHPQGGSHIKVELDAQGQVSKVVVQYSTKDGATQLSTKFQEAKQKIEKAGEDAGLKIEMVPMDLPKFYETLPGKVGSLGRFEGFFRPVPDHWVDRAREKRRQKKPFESTNPFSAALLRKPGAPEWLAEFLKKYFDGVDFIPEREAAAKKEEKTEEALKTLELTREDILKDPEVVNKRWRNFAKQYHPDKFSQMPDSEKKEAQEKYIEIKKQADYLQNLVDKAKADLEAKGKEKPGDAKSEETEGKSASAEATADKADAAKVETPAPTAFESGLLNFLKKVEEKVPGAHPLFELVRGIRNFFAKQWYGEDWRQELEAAREERVIKRAENRARKDKIKAEKEAAKKPYAPAKPAEAGPKIEGPRAALPPGTAIPEPKIVMGEKVPGSRNEHLKMGKLATEWMGGFSGRTDEGVGYPPPEPGKPKSAEKPENQDVISYAFDAEGNLYFFTFDGMGGHEKGKEVAVEIAGEATAEAKRGSGLEAAFRVGNHAGFHNVPGDSGAVGVGIKIIRPGKAGEPHSLDTGWGGDGKFYLFRRNSKGQYEWIYQNVEETMARLVESGVLEPAKVDEMIEKFGEGYLSLVSNSFGRAEQANIRRTAEGEVPDPANPGKTKKAEGLSTIALAEGDVALLGSDCLKNLPPEKIAELIKDCKTAEEIRDVLYEELVRRMSILNDARESRIQGDQRYAFKYDGKKLFIDFKGDVYDAKVGGKKVDHFHTDNISLTAYLHQLKAPEAGPGKPPGLPPKGRPELPQGNGESGNGESGGGGPKPEGEGSGSKPEGTGAETPKDPENSAPGDSTKNEEPKTDPSVTVETPAEKPSKEPEEKSSAGRTKASEASPSGLQKFRFKSTSLEEFAEKYAPYLSADGFQYPQKNPPPEGTALTFEVLLADDSTLISGEGRIVKDSASGKTRIRFEKLSPEARQTWEKIVSKKETKPTSAETTADKPASTEATADKPKTPYQEISNLDEVLRLHGDKLATDRKVPEAVTLQMEDADLAGFVQRAGGRISLQGMFLPLENPLPVGRSVHFRFQLPDRSPLVSGLGTVISSRIADPAKPEVAPGITVRFEMLSPEGSKVIQEIAAKKTESGGGNSSSGANGGGTPGKDPAKLRGEEAAESEPTKVTPAPPKRAPEPSAPRPLAEALEPNTQRVMKIPFKAATHKEFLAKYGKFFEANGVFIPLRNPHPEGTQAGFQFRLSDGTVILELKGTVVESRPSDTSKPGVTPGMRIRIDEITPEFRKVWDEILVIQGVEPVTKVVKQPIPPAAKPAAVRAATAKPASANPTPLKPTDRATQPPREHQPTAAPKPNGRSAPEPQVLQIRAHAETPDQFVRGYPGRVHPNGMSFPIKRFIAPGTKMGFEITSKKDGTSFLKGEGEVTSYVAYDPQQPDKPYGAILRFTNLSPADRATVARMVAVQLKKDSNSKKDSSVPTGTQPSQAAAVPQRPPLPPPVPPRNPGRKGPPPLPQGQRPGSSSLPVGKE